MSRAGLRQRVRAAAHAVLFAVASLLARTLPAARRRPVVHSLWAGTPIINMAVNARAERHLGVAADSLVYETYYITDAFTWNLSRWMRVPVLRTIVPYAVLVWAVARYQRFHFYCDRGLLPSPEPFRFDVRELRLLKRLGKQVFLWTYGADVRTRERTQALGTYNCCTDCPAPGTLCICDERAGRASYAAIAGLADGVFSLGDMTEYTPGSINDVHFWPVDLDADDGRRYAPRRPAAVANAPVRVVHAANHRHFRGTRFLIDAVERLRAEGREIELVLVERTPNDEALELYRSADVIFDNCLIGSYGYFGLEGMALGKPVLAFVRRPDRYLLHPEACPVVDTPPDRVAEVLAELLDNPARRRELGERGRRYVERYHTPRRFAERLGRAYRELGVTDV